MREHYSIDGEKGSLDIVRKIMKELKEIWKWIGECPPNSYQVSNLGRVRSVKRIILTKTGKTEHRKSVILKPKISIGGYPQVVLCIKNEPRYRTIHSLVAKNFYQVNHKNGNKKDNRLENLEWVTPRQNQDHALATGLMKSREIPIQCIENGFAYTSISAAARDINGKAYAICKVLSGKQKHHKGFSFKYLKLRETKNGNVKSN